VVTAAAMAVRWLGLAWLCSAMAVAVAAVEAATVVL